MNFWTKNLLNFLKITLIGAVLVVISLLVFVFTDKTTWIPFGFIIAEIIGSILILLFISFKRKYILFSKINIKQSVISLISLLITFSWMTYIIFFMYCVYAWAMIHYTMG